MYKYSLYNLKISSSFKMADLQETDFVRADVEIRRGGVPEKLDKATWLERFYFNNDSILYRSGQFKTCICNGHKIRLEVEGLSEETVQNHILGFAFPLLLLQRKIVTLHGSAVQKNGETVIFCAPSGTGKST